MSQPVQLEFIACGNGVVECLAKCGADVAGGFALAYPASPAADQNKVRELVESFRQIEARHAKIELHFTTLCPPHMVYILRRPVDVGESPVPVRP